jgi:integrase
VTIEVARSFNKGLETEASRKPVPLDAHVAADLWLWKDASTYSKSEDWIFASPRTHGKYPYWPDALLLKIVQPAARRAGITKRIGWHTFRHSYSSLMVANGENVKVVQELMRHASSRFTLDIYSQAPKAAKRQAQERVVQVILSETFDDPLPAISLGGTRPEAK